MSKRGGFRAGAGRPPVIKDAVLVHLRIGAAQREALKKLGGAQWVRAQIDKESQICDSPKKEKNS